MTAPSTARTYSLGPVLPHVRQAAELVGGQFGVTTILGWRATARDMLGHPAGRALDFMTYRDRALGDRVNAFLLDNAEALGVTYTIWQQTYYKPGEPPEPMADRGSPTQNHEDHVHGSFRALPGSGAVKAPAVDGGSSTFDGWSGGLMAIGLKAAVTGAALVLVVAGTRQAVKN